MSADTLFKILFKMQAFLNMLHVINLSLLNEINKHVYAGLLSMLDGLLINRRRYFRVMKHKLTEIAI
jgi:hypothetical protein